MKTLLFLLIFVFANIYGLSPGFCNSSKIFEFYLPWDDNQKNFIDLSYLNDKPAGRRGYLTVGGDGHFYSGGKREKFLGVNIVGYSCFPDHKNAEIIAKRLAKYGINIVRFALLDMIMEMTNQESIFDESYKNSRHLNSSTLDKFDYFFAKLKENGIYSNINLLSGRYFLASDGLPESISNLTWKEQESAACFDERLIYLQKEYAKNLLDRINPYTGTTYLNDPALAIVEINNENGMIYGWLSGAFDKLPDEFYCDLKERWNRYLLKQYKSNSNLKKKWYMKKPLGKEMLRNNDFSKGLSYWDIWQYEGGISENAVLENACFGSPAVKIKVLKKGVESWHIQLLQGNLKLETGVPYRFVFWAKADSDKAIEFNVCQSYEPWQSLGVTKKIDLTTSWKQYEISFVVNNFDNNARISFTGMQDEFSAYYFAKCSLLKGGSFGLLENENLNKGNIDLIKLNMRQSRTSSALNDWVKFLISEEDNYWTQMSNYLKKSLNVKSLIIGTVVNVSTPHLLENFDFVDSHEYWQHPFFPNKEWDSKDWYVKNATLVNAANGGTIANLSFRRIHGKPYTVTEYNHPAPNTYSSEAYLFLSAYASMQDWDGIFGFTYNSFTRDWSPSKMVKSYFDLEQDPLKFMSFIPAACLYRRGDVSASKESVYLSLNKDEEANIISKPDRHIWDMDMTDVSLKGIKKAVSLIHKTSILTQNNKMPDGGIYADQVVLPKDNNFVSDTKELNWDTTNGIFKIDSRLSKVLIGFICGKEFNMNGVTIKAGKTIQNWAAITLTVMEGNGFDKPSSKILLTANDCFENKDMGWKIYPDKHVLFPPPLNENITVGYRWGNSPTLVEGINADIVLSYNAKKIKVYSMDGRGNRVNKVPVLNKSGKAQFTISNKYKTLWYEIVLQ